MQFEQTAALVPAFEPAAGAPPPVLAPVVPVAPVELVPVPAGGKEPSTYAPNTGKPGGNLGGPAPGQVVEIVINGPDESPKTTGKGTPPPPPPNDAFTSTTDAIPSALRATRRAFRKQAFYSTLSEHLVAR
ncbi:hypothetical protein MTO96_008784 [Rhipicephalus appendiculatus]